jgi:hypothetical protein
MRWLAAVERVSQFMQEVDLPAAVLLAYAA